MLNASTGPITSLYIHVPFCAHKCEYCAFYSEASHGELIQRFVNALVRELELIAHDLKPRTLFFGGGTPSLLNLRQWEQILSTMQRLELLGADEWTIECNPATVSPDKAMLWRDHGVNRLSLGVQSLDEQLLDRLGRIHSRDMVFRSFDILRRAGFDNLNLDLMFAIPGQTLELWRSTLVEALALGSEHLSCYEVIYEQDTPLYEQLQAGQFAVDENLACAMYDELIERADGAGVEQYEIANFARRTRHGPSLSPTGGYVFSAPVTSPSPPAEGGEGWGEEGRLADRCAGMSAVSRPSPRPSPRSFLTGRGSAVRALSTYSEGEVREGKAPVFSEKAPVSTIPSFACRHNINYWQGGSYHALGPSAAGYVRGVRTKNWSNTQLYCEQLERGQRAIESREELPPLQRAGETAAFGLRMNAGWPFDQFKQTTGYDLRIEWKEDMERLVAQDWGHGDAQRFRLTRAGLRFADSAAAMFLR